VLGRAYTDAECEALLLRDVIEHGRSIQGCLPESLPVETRAAFISAAFNIGSSKFCGSSMSRKARAGDLRGACAALSLWINAGGKPLKGLISRRAAERQLCEQGIA
jgi:lysozyme